jgi:hypothetical protein
MTKEMQDTASGITDVERALHVPKRRQDDRPGPGCARGMAGVGMTEFSAVPASNPSLAIQFLADFAQDGLHPCDPSAQTTLTNFIRKAKGAKNRGLLSGDRPLQELYQVARDRFGIDPDKIDAV